MRHECTPTRRDVPRGKKVGYRVTALPDSVVRLAGDGLFAVHTSDGRTTRVFYCEPATGRCSCGATSGS